MKLKGIAGTSVGALNGALICMGDLEKAERLWENISYSKIMSVDDEVMGEIFKHKKISRGNPEGVADGLHGRRRREYIPVKAVDCRKCG